MTHLAHLLRGMWFRRLFAVRLSSQFADGVFQTALASYALFSQRQVDPAEIAAALAVVLLPFSVLGPFAGVLLDRWSRRQVLAWANFARVGIVGVVAVVVAAGWPDPVFYGVVLLCLSVNRFLLAGLSAALPHTVSLDDLVTANAVTPTAGTLAFVVGLGSGGAVRLAGDVAVLLTASSLYAVAGTLALRIPRHLLGPSEPAPPLRTALRSVVRGLFDGLRHLARRPSAAAGLAVIAAHRFWFGLSSVALILLYRNYFHGPDQADAAFADLGLATLVGGLGFLAAAILTPVVTERLGAAAWILLLLVAAGASQVFPAGLYTRPALLASVFALGLAAQGIKICVDTLVQTGVEDDFRGRVFSLYDVLFNVAFVAAAATAAGVLPEDGRSYAVLATIAGGYLLTAAGYAVFTRRCTAVTPCRELGPRCSS